MVASLLLSYCLPTAKNIIFSFLKCTFPFSIILWVGYMGSWFHSQVQMPVGLPGRNSHTHYIREVIGWGLSMWPENSGRGLLLTKRQTWSMWQRLTTSRGRELEQGLLRRGKGSPWGAGWVEPALIWFNLSLEFWIPFWFASWIKFFFFLQIKTWVVTTAITKKAFQNDSIAYVRHNSFLISNYWVLSSFQIFPHPLFTALPHINSSFRWENWLREMRWVALAA